MPALSFVDHLARAAGEPDLAAIIEDLVADPRGLARLRVDMGDVGHVDRQLLVDDAAVIAHARFGVPPRDMDALHDEAALGRQHPQHFARLPLIAAADDDDVVALLDLRLRHLQHFRSERDDLHESPRSEFARDRPEDARPDGFPLMGDQDRRVAVETNGAAVRPADLLRGADDDCAMDIALLDAAARDRLLHGDDNDVADRRGPALGTPQNLDALDPARARIIGDVEVGLHLDHGAPPASSAAAGGGAGAARRPAAAPSEPASTTQCLRFEIGRLSSIRTASPAR